MEQILYELNTVITKDTIYKLVNSPIYCLMLAEDGFDLSFIYDFCSKNGMFMEFVSITHYYNIDSSYHDMVNRIIDEMPNPELYLFLRYNQIMQLRGSQEMLIKIIKRNSFCLTDVIKDIPDEVIENLCSLEDYHDGMFGILYKLSNKVISHNEKTMMKYGTVIGMDRTFITYLFDKDEIVFRIGTPISQYIAQLSQLKNYTWMRCDFSLEVYSLEMCNIDFVLNTDKFIYFMKYKDNLNKVLSKYYNNEYDAKTRTLIEGYASKYINLSDYQDSDEAEYDMYLQLGPYYLEYIHPLTIGRLTTELLLNLISNTFACKVISVYPINHVKIINFCMKDHQYLLMAELFNMIGLDPLLEKELLSVLSMDVLNFIHNHGYTHLGNVSENTITDELKTRAVN